MLESRFEGIYIGLHLAAETPPGGDARAGRPASGGPLGATLSHDTMSRGESKRRRPFTASRWMVGSRLRRCDRKPPPKRELPDARLAQAGMQKFPDFPHNSCGGIPAKRWTDGPNSIPLRRRPGSDRRLEATGGVRNHDALREGGVDRVSPVVFLSREGRCV